MTRLQALLENGCTVYEAEIIGLKLDALGSDAERAEWIERHMAKFLAAIRIMESLKDAQSRAKTLEKLYDDAERNVGRIEQEVDTDPYCEEVRALLSHANTRAWYNENMYGKRTPSQKWATREAIEAREAEMRKAALEAEAEDALKQAVQIAGGAQ